MRFTTLSNYHLIDDAMFVCLLDELILGFCYRDLTWETGGLELASNIILVLQANRPTKCASHPLSGYSEIYNFCKNYRLENSKNLTIFVQEKVFQQAHELFF